MNVSPAQQATIAKVDKQTILDSVMAVRRGEKTNTATGKSTTMQVKYAAVPCQLSPTILPNPTPDNNETPLVSSVFERAAVLFAITVPGEDPGDDPIEVMVFAGDEITIEGKVWEASSDAEWPSGFSDLHRVQVHRANTKAAAKP